MVWTEFLGSRSTQVFCCQWSIDPKRKQRCPYGSLTNFRTVAGAMIELISSELHCSTNPSQIYDRLSDPLETKWKRSAKLYRDKTGVREPTLNEISAFIIAESQTENDLVYGRPSCPTPRVGNGARRRKPFWNPKGPPAPPVTALTTQVQTEGILISGQQSNEVKAKRGGQNVKDGSVQREICKVCKGKHSVAKCGVFSMESLNWRRQFARSNALCYCYLSTSHLRRRCPVKNGFKESFSRPGKPTFCVACAVGDPTLSQL